MVAKRARGKAQFYKDVPFTVTGFKRFLKMTPAYVNTAGKKVGLRVTKGYVENLNNNVMNHLDSTLDQAASLAKTQVFDRPTKTLTPELIQIADGRTVGNISGKVRLNERKKTTVKKTIPKKQAPKQQIKKKREDTNVSTTDLDKPKKKNATKTTSIMPLPESFKSVLKQDDWVALDDTTRKNVIYTAALLNAKLMGEFINSAYAHFDELVSEHQDPEGDFKNWKKKDWDKFDPITHVTTRLTNFQRHTEAVLNCVTKGNISNAEPTSTIVSFYLTELLINPFKKLLSGIPEYNKRVGGEDKEFNANMLAGRFVNTKLTYK